MSSYPGQHSMGGMPNRDSPSFNPFGADDFIRGRNAKSTDKSSLIIGALIVALVVSLYFFRFSTEAAALWATHNESKAKQQALALPAGTGTAGGAGGFRNRR